jgi:hypothetical protein
MEIYFGKGNETNCPNCSTEIEYPLQRWVLSDDKVRITGGYCPNNGCPIYRPLSTVPGYESAVRFRTWRYATEDEIEKIKEMWGEDLPFRSHDNCPRHPTRPLMYLGHTEIGDKETVEGVCVMPDCDFKIDIPLEEARKIIDKRTFSIPREAGK